MKQLTMINDIDTGSKSNLASEIDLSNEQNQKIKLNLDSTTTQSNGYNSHNHHHHHPHHDSNHQDDDDEDGDNQNLSKSASSPLGTIKSVSDGIDLTQFIANQQQSLAAIAKLHCGGLPNGTPRNESLAADVRNRRFDLSKLSFSGDTTTATTTTNAYAVAVDDSVKKRLSLSSLSPPPLKSEQHKGREKAISLSINNSNCGGDGDTDDTDSANASIDGSDDKSAKHKTAPQNMSNVRRLLAGVSLTLLSAFFFSVTTVIVKQVTDIKPSQMALFRYIGILILSFPVVIESRESWFGQNNWWWRLWMLLRGMSGATSLFFRYSAVKYISLADTTIILLSMPVFVFIFARIFLKEPFGRFHVLALIMSIIGIAFASKLDVLFDGRDSADASIVDGFDYNITTTTMMTTTNRSIVNKIKTETTTTNAGDRVIGTLFACGAMFVGSLVYIMVRKMRKTHHSVILFNFGIIAIIEMVAVNAIFYDFKLPTHGHSAYLITILAVLSFYGQLLLTKAIQIEEAGVVSVVRVSGEAFFAFVLQITFFGEIPDVYTITGAILVLSSVFLLSFRKYVISLSDDSPLKRKLNWLTK